MKRLTIPVYVTLLVLIFFAVMAERLIDSAPSVTELERLKIAPSEDTVILGHDALWQHESSDSAADEHLRVVYKHGRWFFGNVAKGKGLVVYFRNGTQRELNRIILQTGDIIQAAGARITVTKAESRALDLRAMDGSWVDFKYGRLLFNDPSLDTKVHIDWNMRVFAKWFLQPKKRQILLFNLGGNISDGSNWAIDALLRDSLRLYWQDGDFLLGGGSRGVVIQLIRLQKAELLEDQLVETNLPGNEITHLIIGRTKYAVKATTKDMILQPTQNWDVWGESVPLPPPMGITSSVRTRQWIGQGPGIRDLVQSQGLLMVAFFAAGLLPLFIVLGLRFGKIKYLNLGTKSIICHFSTAALFAVICGALTESVLTDGCMILTIFFFSWFYASIVLWINGHLKGTFVWFWVCSAFLASTGVINLYQLACTSSSTKMLEYANSQTLIVSLLPCIIAMAAANPRSYWERLIVRFMEMEWPLYVIPIILFLGVVYAFVSSNGQGMLASQFAEAAKLEIVLVLAFFGMHIIDERTSRPQAFCKQPIFNFIRLTFIGLFMFIMVQFMDFFVGDFSPIIVGIIIFISWLWNISSSTQYGIKPLRFDQGVRIVLIIFSGIGILTAGYLYHYPEALESISTKVTERIEVWKDPGMYPHAAYQTLQSLALIRQGGWMGANLDHVDKTIHMLPQALSDFVGTSIIFYQGGLYALQVILIQCGMVLTGLSLARELRDRTISGDWRYRLGGLYIGMSCFALLIIHATQWAIGWGNSLKIFPVMGQPQTWLALGKAHMLWIAFPLLLCAWWASFFGEDTGVGDRENE